VLVAADLDLKPTGLPNRGYPSNIPLSGKVLAKYDGRTEVVNIDTVNVKTPQTTLTTSGVLGVNNGDPLTNLQVNLQARDLGEFDQTLQTLGFQNNGKKGSAAIPVVLHGTMGFVGTAKGAIANLDVKGHLVADNLAVKLGTVTDVHIDSVVGDAEYSPNSGVAVAGSTITRGTAVLNVAGSFAPRKVVSRHGVVTYVWDDGLALNTTVKLVNAQMSDLLQIAGQPKVPVTGVANINLHAAGTLRNLNGTGNITLTNGAAYGENYQTISVDVNAQGQQVNASRVLLMAHDMSITGSGSYNIENKHIIAQVQGNNLVLSKFDMIAKANTGVDGTLTINATANGTLEEPNLHAKLGLANVSVEGKPIGSLNATADSAGSLVSYNVQSDLVGATLVVAGKTSLVGDYQTDAKLTLSGLDIAKPLALFSPGSVKASSSIGGTITVSGPAAKPTQLTGTADFGDFDVKLEGVELKSAEPMRASLHAGVLKIDALHITGLDTDLRAGGSATLFGDSNAKGGAINLNANGSISMVIAHTFDTDLLTSGKVTFNVAATGRVKAPELNGSVKFNNVNLAVDGIPNGLSSLNGTMVFNENRLTMQDVTAMTGGGQLKLGGSISYENGTFADITATGANTRVRLYGLSATANASFHLQGGPQSVRLSGDVLITRFGVGADVDFAAFGGAGGVQAPPDPNSATNKISLDIHVTSAPQLDFQNSYAKLAGNVDLTIRGTVAVPSVLGRIQITDGSATFAGTNYQLQRGNIYFSNPVRIDPTIDLDATARVENYDITIGLHGTATSIKPTYRSEPPLTEADIFNLLALGRTQEEAQLYQEQQVQAGTDPTTSALLGGALNATVSSRSQQLIQLQYQINENNSLVATRDESGVFSIVYKIRKRYR
jgi:translocation and assembly module TamB